MQIPKTLRRFFGQESEIDRGQAPKMPATDPEPEVTVPEILVRSLLEAGPGEHAPLILDVREQFEWDQVHIDTTDGWCVRHIPMNQVPDQLASLQEDDSIAVLCAHGSRSYGVAHYLIEQGLNASNIAGGITQWHIQSGPIELRTTRP